jgi:hypothetical protein
LIEVKYTNCCKGKNTGSSPGHKIFAIHLGLGYQDAALPTEKIPYTSNDSARMFRYSEEWLRRTIRRRWTGV